VKRRDLINKAQEMGFVLIRHGGKHDVTASVLANEDSSRIEQIPGTLDGFRTTKESPEKLQG
jgi:hypothetical protein